MVGVGFFFLPFLLDPIKSLHFCKKDFFTVDIAHPPQKWKANTYKSLIFTSQTAQPNSHSKPQQPFQNPEHEKNMNCLTHTSSLLTQIQRFSAKKKSHLNRFKQMKNHCFWKQYKNFASDSTFCLRSEHDAATKQYMHTLR